LRRRLQVVGGNRRGGTGEEETAMVIKVMKWPLWPLFSKKFQVSLTLNRLEGLSSSVVQKPGSRELVDDDTKLHVHVKWKGPKGSLGSHFRSMKWGKTSAASAGSSGMVSWEEEFENICVFTTGKTGAFQPWHVYLVLCKVTQFCKPFVHMSNSVFMCFLDSHAFSLQGRKGIIMSVVAGMFRSHNGCDVQVSS
jgi:hypothetical protein